jgi:hypothetical protein
MKSLQKRLNQLYEQQAMEEKKVLQSLQKTIENLSPFSTIKNSLSDIMSSVESESYYSKKSFTLLVNKTIDTIIPKPEIINQTIKVLVQKRFIDVLFDNHKVISEERELETNNTNSEL